MINSLSSKSIWIDTGLVSSNNSNSFPVVLDIQCIYTEFVRGVIKHCLIFLNGDD